MLINLNSPEKPNSIPYQKTYLKNPLIPGPDVNCNVESNNPFDVVASSAENWDPFELVLRESLKKFENTQNRETTSSRKHEHFNKKLKSPSTTTAKIDNDQGKRKNPCKVFRSQSMTENVKFFRSPTKKCERVEPDSPPCSVDDSSFSITKLKRRVSKCIEKALNSSLSQPNLATSLPSSPTKSPNVSSKYIGCASEVSVVDKNISLPNCNILDKGTNKTFSNYYSKSFCAPENSKVEVLFSFSLIFFTIT